MTTRCLTLAILILAARTASAHTPIAPPSHKSGKPLALPLNESAYAALQRLWSERSDSPFVLLRSAPVARVRQLGLASAVATVSSTAAIFRAAWGRYGFLSRLEWSPGIISTVRRPLTSGVHPRSRAKRSSSPRNNQTSVSSGLGV